MPDLNSIERFSGLVGEKFIIQGLPSPDMVVELQQVVQHELTDKMESFSLFFLGPDHPVLPQATYSLSNSDTGKLDIFLVPVGKNSSGILYEAVFNLFRSE